MKSTRLLFCIISAVLLTAPFYGRGIQTEDVHSGAEISTIRQLSREEWQNIIPRGIYDTLQQKSRYSSRLKTSELYSLAIKNNSPQKYWHLELTKQLELVSVFYVSPDNSPLQNSVTHRNGSGAWAGLISGDMVPMEQRPHPSALLVIPIHLAPYSETVLYIEARDFQVKHPGFSIQSPEATAKKIERSSALLFFVYTFMFIAAVYNLILYLHKSNQAHLYYALTMCSLLIALLGKHRVLSSIFFPNLPYGYFVYIFFNSIAAASALMFCIHFFRVTGKSRLRTTMKSLAALLTLIAGAAFIFPVPVLGDVMNAIIVPSLAIILIIATRMGLKSDIPFRFVLISLVPICVVFMIDNLLLYFSVPQPQMFPLFQTLGIVVHIILINYGLIIRSAEIAKAYTTLLNRFEERVVDEVKSRTVELETHANTDPLTNLLNRKHLEEKIKFLEEKNERAQETGIIFIDIDNFKQLNDEFGHKTGDLILQRTARFLQKNTRDSDSVFRYGGDEFLILMPGADTGLVQILGNRLLDNYRWIIKPITDTMPAFTNSISLSIGGCCWSKDSEISLHEAIHCADSALLRAKREGKSKMVYQS